MRGRIRALWLVVVFAACSVPEYGFQPDGSADPDAGEAASGASGASGAGTGGSGGALPDTGTDQGSGGCSSNADCAAQPATPVCNTTTSSCVECLDGDSTCAAGQFCKNNSCVTGCETSADCAPLPNTDSGLCEQGVCVVGPCASGYEDCNGTVSDGCEANLLTDTNNCGTCSFVCDLLNASGTCEAGLCKIVSCSGGYQSCDLDDANGCEVDITKNVAHCGQCDKPCATGSICTDSSCMTTGCGPGLVTCGSTNCACAGDGCCGTSCQTKHNNGLGQNWYDCTAYGTYDQTQAAKACQAHMPGTGACIQFTCNAGLAMCNADTYACWGFTSDIAGKVYKKTGGGPPGAICPLATDANWDP